MAAPMGKGSAMDDVPNLTPNERQILEENIRKAQDFENMELKQLFQGTLMKYTNVMKGWQYRYFILNPELGSLEYFVVEDGRRASKARACLFLAGAVISPSDEDSHTFSVNAASGEVYRLRAYDARERHQWVTRLRSAAEEHAQDLSAPPLVDVASARGADPYNVVQHYNSFNELSIAPVKTGQKPVTVQDPFQAVKEMLHRTSTHNNTLVDHIEALPTHAGENIGSLSKDLLVLKATSQATMVCLEQCLGILEQQQHVGRRSPGSARVSIDTPPMPRSPFTRGNANRISATKDKSHIAEAPLAEVPPPNEKSALAIVYNDLTTSDEWMTPRGQWSLPGNTADHFKHRSCP